MPQKPLFPPPQNHPGPARPPAPHVRAALGAAQPKLAGALPAGRQAVAHVQAALGRGNLPVHAPAPVQPKPAAARAPAVPAPHVAKTTAAVQAKPVGGLSPAARPAAPHVQAAIGRGMPPALAAASVQAKASPAAGSVAQCGKRVQKTAEELKAEKFRAIRKEVRESKGKLRHKRYPTAYGAFNKARKSSQQGPHTTAHIATSSALEVAREGGTSLSSLVNSAVIPRPRQVNRYIRKGLKNKGRYPQEKKRVKRFVKQYQTLYTKAVNNDDEIAIEKLIEKNPVATYGWDEGKVSHKEISGKGERRNIAIDDFESYREGTSIEDLKTVDTTSGLSKSTEHRYDQLSRLTYGHEEFSEDDGSSESDSDMDLD